MWNKLSPLKSVSDDYKELRARELAETESCKTAIGFCPPTVVTAQDDDFADWLEVK